MVEHSTKLRAERSGNGRDAGQGDKGGDGRGGEANGPGAVGGKVATERCADAESGGDDERTAQRTEKCARAYAGPAEKPGEAGQGEDSLGNCHGKSDAGDAAGGAEPDGGGDHGKGGECDRGEAASVVACDAKRVSEIRDVVDCRTDREPAEDGRGGGPLITKDEADEFVRNGSGEGGERKSKVCDDVGADEALNGEPGRRG